MLYNVYRRLGLSSWQHGPCETGVPAASGYSLIGFTSPTTYSFTDYDLWTTPNGTKGNYIVTTMLDDCSESFATTQTVTLIVGLSENEAFSNAFKVFPNPFNQDLNVMCGDEKDVWCTLFSADGSRVREQWYLPGMVLNLHDLPDGFYFLQVKSQKGMAIRKVQKCSQ
jgi:hypothetical protein